MNSSSKILVFLAVYFGSSLAQSRSLVLHMYTNFLDCTCKFDTQWDILQTNPCKCFKIANEPDFSWDGGNFFCYEIAIIGDPQSQLMSIDSAIDNAKVVSKL